MPRPRASGCAIWRGGAGFTPAEAAQRPPARRPPSPPGRGSPGAAAAPAFLLYPSIAGGGNPSIAPSALQGRTGEVQLAGLVVGPVVGDAHAGGLRFRLRDISGKEQAPPRGRGPGG